jgi:preprotein translocase subunit SecE
MATKDEDKQNELGDAELAEKELGAALVQGEGLVVSDAEASADDAEGAAVTVLGPRKYVHAAFIGAGLLVAYLSGRLLSTIWNLLADWPALVRSVPQLLLYGEEERGSMMLAVGALIGLVSVVQAYRKPRIRQWADDVADELSKVTWPDKEVVTNGTMVVVVTSIVAAVYVALLDRLWSFLTTLVYGA